jgi:nuclear transport factor 2 (NTF2) superfamily protein
MDAKKWLQDYGRAWETRDPDMAACLFTRDVHYWETPFGEPIVSREGVREYWKRATDQQEDIHFTVKDSFTVGHELIAQWGCTYRHKPSGEERELAGILLANFYGEEVRAFREYWHRRTLPK